MNKIYTLLFFTIFCLSAAVNAQNQASDYLFNRTSEPYQPLENDTTLGSGFQDDVLYMGRNLSSGPENCVSCSLTGPGLPIGFDFLFDGQTFTRWGFSSNGYIKLGNGTFTIRNSLASVFSSVFDSTENTNIIAALHGDIVMTEIQGSFRYRTIGNPGSRILVVEYRAMKHWVPTITTEEVYNFQIRLHEGSNKISFAYGPFLKDGVSRTYDVGIRGRFFRNIHLRELPPSATSWTQNVRGASVNSTMLANTEITPIDGMVFNFVPRQYDNDLSLVDVLSPLSGLKSCPMSATEPVRVRIKNEGLLAQSSATVGFRVGNGPAVTQPITLTPPLAAQQTREVTLTGTADLTGFNPRDLSAFVFIPNEEEGSRNNDTLSISFRIGQPFETSTISSYDTLRLRGWMPGRGATIPTGDYSLWRPSTSFGVNSSALEMRTDTPAVKNEWFYSPGYKVDTAFNYGINFSAALTSGLTGTGAITDIGDDTIKFMYSTDCRQTWKLLKKFSSAELTSGEINNTLKPFEVFLPPSVKQLVTFGFFGKNNGNAFPNAYRFHFRNFYLRRVPRFDLSADTVTVPSVVSLSCRYSGQEPLTIKITNRGFDNIDSTDAGFFINGGLVIKKKFGFNPPLEPGAKATLLFDGTSGADLSVQDGTFITGFVALRKENVEQRLNDTARRVYGLIAGQSIPTPVYPTYASALAARWQRGRGSRVPSGNFSFWGNRTTLPGQQTAGIDMAATPNDVNDWLYSASYEGPSIVRFVFKAAVAGIGAGGNPVTTMNQDSIKALYSVDCGASWQAVKTFSTADLTSGILTNSLKEFSFELFNTRGSILVGFAAFRKATNPVTAGYTFHVDSISITTPSFPDFSATGLLPGIQGTVTCPGSTPVALGVVVRNSGSVPITTATVGYRLNGVPTSKVVNFAGTGLAVGKTDTVRFTGSEAPVYNAPGNYILKGFVNLPAEAPSTAFNDSSNINIFTLFGLVPVPYNETFQRVGLLPIGWVSDTASGRGFKHTLGRGPGGGQALSFRSQTGSTRASVITRNFGVITSSTNFVSLAYRSQDNTNALFRLRPTDYIDVLVSTDCGTTYSPIGRIDSINQQIAAGFLAKDFPIDALAGQNITVKLDVKMTPKPFQTVFLDVSRFSIGTATSVADILDGGSEGLHLFPNPATRESGISFHSPDFYKSAEAYASNGQRIPVSMVQSEEGVYRISTSNLNTGVYVLLLQGPKGPVRLRFMIGN